MIENTDFNFLENTEFLKAKKRISKELTAIFAQAEQELKSVIQSSDFKFPERTFSKTGKISKGENYKDLPYFILDFPRKFSNESTFAYRVMLWWGHEISTTLHIGGDMVKKYQAKILESKNDLENHYLCNHTDPWDYDFEPSNYLPINRLSKTEIQQIMKGKDFVKISKPFPLSKINQLPKIAEEQLRLYLNILGEN